ncbi:hypothetical protein F0L74_21060 [Chitinophaga agrisoli]|uniref:Fibronectin type 3 domain-containing protein n=1 Tax=Chitinophaga agrisoli TaxID=2607653 RepID=A0A5B2VJG9_9BACT|nr:hypothetical protein [Chitinophaga agrisoli]KAA2238710.1 hypothetical protein F0L74_21060 [Chitinophaga agrisoli]
MYRILSSALFLLLLLLVGLPDAAAQQEHRIVGVADAQPDKRTIRLRWSPASYVAWEMGNKYGYTVERFTIAANGQLIEQPKPVLLTPRPLAPYTLFQMETAAQQEPRIAVVAEMLYGDKVEKIRPEEGIGAWFENQNQLNWRMAMALLSCDMSIDVAKSAGLYLEDHNVKRGERYVYRIALAKQPANLVIDTAIVAASLDEPTRLVRPQELAIVCADRTATLGWLTSYSKQLYTAYTIERATDGKNFRPVTPLPILPTGPDAAGFSYYQDSLPDNETKYSYRVRGITPFGDNGPWSQTVEGTGVTDVADRPIVDTIIVKDNKQITLRWQLPGKLSKQLSQVMVTRADNSKGPFLPIATFKTPVYEFVDEKPQGTNYYRIKGVTKNGKTIYSFPYFAQIIDTIPPAMPTGLAGKIDSLGIVTLQWAQNREKDLQGYRVFRANSAKEEFIEVTRDIMPQPQFTDTVTLHTLTSKVYYRIIAVDKNYNTSDYTAFLEIKRPDTIAPSAPLITNAFRSDSLRAIVLQWRNSASTDVVKYTLYRINTKDSTRGLAAAWDSTNKREAFADTAVQLGNTYYYELSAWDGAGNQARELSGDVWFETGKRAAITDWKATVNDRKHQVLLSWRHTLQDVKQYRIYRAKNNEPFTLYATQNEGPHEWADEEVHLGNIYRYRITAVLKGDVKTEMSRVLEVKF